jgi:hypothetical protein
MDNLGNYAWTSLTAPQFAGSRKLANLFFVKKPALIAPRFIGSRKPETQSASETHYTPLLLQEVENANDGLLTIRRYVIASQTGSRKQAYSILYAVRDLIAALPKRSKT